MLNSIILMGRATKTPEVRNEGNIVNFDIAVDNIRKESDGSQSTSFFKVTCFGKVAENVSKYVNQGSKIAVQGSIVQRSYVTKNGEKRSTYDVIADSVEFLDPKPKDDESVEPTFDPDKELNEAIEGVGVATPQEAGEPVVEIPQGAKFDPNTGKPLSPKSKK